MPLGELCRPKQWKSLKQSDMTKSGFPVYGANGIIGHYSEYNHADETILIGCRGTCGEVNVCQPKSYVTSNAMCLDGLSECVDKQFLFCFLKAYDFRKVIGGTSQPQITKSGISSIEVPLFPLEDQRRITLRLLSVLKVIENRRTLLGKLDSLVKSRFVEIFGDFACYETKPLIKCVDCIEAGKSPKCLAFSRKMAEPGVLKLSAISSGVYCENENKALPRSVSLTIDKVVHANDILLSRKNTPELVGRSVLVKHTDGNIMFPDIIFRMHPLPPINAMYLSYLLAGPLLHSIQSLAHGSAKSMSNIPKSELAKLSIPIPALNLQNEFANFVSQVDKSRFAGTFTGTINVKNYAISCSVHNNSGRIPNEALHSAREVTECALLELQELYDSLTQKYFAL